MSTLTELDISGIRAFDNHQTQRLLFNTPLTLICGANGVGKTTVIECLRYATTGDLPPNAKGGAFIHDPKMSSKSTVKAQVRLKFRDQQGRPMQVARSMQLTVSKRNVYSMKTLDGYITADVDGQPEAAARPKGTEMNIKSARHADLNEIVPQLLGIPPAILNYVVFCHQEDSLWPLAEASQVKKKFDDIFEATKYTKVLETFKALRRDYSAETKVEERDVDYLGQDVERAEERAKIVAENQKRLDQLAEECSAMRKQHFELSDKLGKALSHRQSVLQLQFDKQDLDKKLDRSKKEINILRDEITEKDLETLDEQDIAGQLESVDERERELASTLDKSRQEAVQLSARIEELNSELGTETNRLGRLQEMTSVNEGRSKKRDELVGGTWTSEWDAKKRAETAELATSIEQLNDQNRLQEDELSGALNSLEATRLQLQQQLLTLRDDLKKGERNVEVLKKQLAEHKVEDEADMEGTLQVRIEEATARLDEAIAVKAQFDSDGVLTKAQRDVREADSVVDEARRTVEAAINASESSSKINFLRGTLKELKASAQKLENQLKEECKKYDVENPREDLKARKEEIESIASKKTKLASVVETQKGVLEKSRSQLSSITSRKDELLVRLKSVDVANFEKQLKYAEEEFMEASEQAEQLSFAHSFFSRALQMAEQENPVCLLCEHHKSSKEASALVTKLAAKLAAFSTPEEARRDTDEKHRRLEELRDFQPLVSELDRLKETSNSVEKEISSLETGLQQLQAEFDTASEQLRSTQSSYDALSGVIEPLCAKLARNEDQIAETEAKVKFESSISEGASTLSLQEAQAQQSDAERALRRAREGAEAASFRERQLATSVSNLTNTVKEMKLQLSEHQRQLSESRRLATEIENLQTSLHAKRSEISQTESRMPELEEQVVKADKDLKSFRHKASQADRDLVDKRNEAVNLLEKVTQISSEIEAFTKEHGNDPIKALQNRISQLSDELAQAKSKKDDLTSVIDELVVKRSNSGAHRRNLSDALRLKRLLSEEVRLQTDFETACKALQEAELSFTNTQWADQIAELQKKVDSLDREIASKTGESRAIAQTIAADQHELATTYEHTAEKYREALYKLGTHTGTIEDLDTLVKILDHSIMSFHAKKMEIINALLDQMWRQTYTGTDIDTILIRSESDSGSSSTRASYNYRVCMVKRDTELDMRGRCSAGQKVLACIIIRMVLAETFGTRAGLIVLDEPTTNLDVKNIEALAQSMHGILNERVAKNFQLIVITHDEEFLRLMSPKDFCENYYLIRRDSKQLSRVESVPIDRLGFEK